MKRFVPFLFICCLSLTGCAAEISPEDAERVAEDIKAYTVRPDLISELKVKFSSTYRLDGTSNRQVVDFKEQNSYTFELSSKYNYIHFSTSSDRKDKVEETSSSSSREEWIFIRKKVLYKAVKDKSIGNEVKTFSRIEKYTSAVSEFSSIFDAYMKKAVENADGKEFLDLDTLTDYIDSEYRSGVKYIAKFYSSGDGNLRIVGGATLDKTTEEGKTAKGAGTLSCKWNDYLLKKAAIGLTVSVTDGTSKNDLKLTVGVNEKVSSFIFPSYPNLNKFAEGNVHLSLYN